VIENALKYSLEGILIDWSKCNKCILRKSRKQGTHIKGLAEELM
jgi:hypothetical protein